MLDATKVVNILLYLFVRKDSGSLYEAKNGNRKGTLTNK